MKNPDEARLEIAAFRRHVIAEAVETGQDGVTQEVARAVAQPWVDPAGRPVQVRERTFWRWLKAYRAGGLLALCPARRKDAGGVRGFLAEHLERAVVLRKERPQRGTRTIIDILVRQKHVQRGQIARSTLDRYFESAGLSRRALGQLGQQVFCQIQSLTPFELVVGDFHHGPYVRTQKDEVRKALLFCFIDHFSRYVPEGRYFLHEDFAALRFSFRRLLVAFGLPVKTYLDNGPAFQSTRFAAGCSALGIELVHSKPYQSEGRGVVERFNRTLLEQFESEVKGRDPLLTLDELNAFFEAWLAERYHKDIHSETGEAPADRFTLNAALRPAPDLTLVDEWLRLREPRTVHRKWSTVEVNTRRYRVDHSLRSRRVNVLYDPFDPSYVLIAYDGRVLERAFPLEPGEIPPQPPAPLPTGPATDYLALLRTDYESRTAAELSAIRLRPSSAPAPELSLPELVVALESCRGAALSQNERSETSAFWRRFRPVDPEVARSCLHHALRRLGPSLHLRVYLDTLAQALMRTSGKGGNKP